ncbi:MAG: glutamine amidotransferase [Rhodobacteraceae bacterium]|nr:glutamine amidotransferase [Paracoccaceae bacterium]MAY46982.1 glutamine amidotransferase [Paracoccaceae bacterium]
MPPRLMFLGNGRTMDGVAKIPERFEALGLHVERRHAFAGDLPDTLDGYDGIFLSGSAHGAYEDIPFIHREHDLIRDAADRDIPMLGVCFGSQILASALCGNDQVFRRERCEIGYKDLPFTKAAADDLLARGLGAAIHMFVWHNDEVRADHPDMTILASSDLCPNQIWRYRDAPVWGIQGHPEITQAAAPVWFEQCRTAMEHDGADIDKLKAAAHEAPGAKTMLARFAGHLLGA